MAFWVTQTIEGYRVIEALGEPNNAVAGPFEEWSKAKLEALDREEGDETRDKVAAVAVVLTVAAVSIWAGWAIISWVVR